MKPIHLAAMRGHLEVVKFFKDVYLSSGQNPWGKAQAKISEPEMDEPEMDGLTYPWRVQKQKYYKLAIQGHTPMSLAAVNNRWEVFKYILEDPSAVNLIGDDIREDVQYLIYGAAENNQVEIVKALINYGVDPSLSSFSESEYTPLHIAAAEDSYDVVQLLLDEGANPRARLSFYAEEHETPLQAAAGRGFDRIVKAILEKDPEAAIDRDAADFTALHIAADGGRFDVVQTLLKTGYKSAGYDPNEYINMPLHQAIRMGTLKMKRGLSAAGYAPDRHFNTPLHSAIKTYNRPEHLRIVEALLEHGAPPDVFDENDLTPLHQAICYGRIDIVSMLLTHGANPNAQNTDRCSPWFPCQDIGITPLYTAVQYENLEIVEVLLEHGASPTLGNFIASDPPSEWTSTPLELAERNELSDIAEALRRYVKK